MSDNNAPQGLETFFQPKGVAVVGASRNPHKLGYGVIRNLKDYNYEGGIYPINPSADEILGIPCFKSFDKVPDPVDLVVLVIPAAKVKDNLEKAAQRNIKYAIVTSGGFSEAGEEGLRMENEIRELARQHGMRLLGPNCIGSIDTHNRVNTTFVAGMPERGEIGFSSQSGAMVASVIDWARGAGVGFSRIASLGNQVDVNETEMIRSIAGDSQTKVVTAYIEGVSDGRAFVETGRELARKKPFIVLKAGKGKSGAEAVASHTGAIAGSSEAYSAAFKKAGMLQASNTEEMFDWARALAWQQLPRGKRVGVLTNAGGPAVLAVDALEEQGLELASFSDETKNYLEARMPAAANIDNPVDVLAGSGPATYAVALDAMLADPNVDAVAVIQAPQDWFRPASLAEVVGEIAGLHGKPVISSLMGKMSVDDALAVLHSRKVPNVTFPERIASVLKVMTQRKEWLETCEEDWPEYSDIDWKKAEEAISARDFKALLEAYRINAPKEVFATNEEEVLESFKSIGGTMVMKLVSKDITHKTDIGGVKLNLRNEEDLRNAWREINETVKAHNGTLQGVLIQPMLEEGHEVIAGFRRDPQFGPLLLFGTGGVDVELQRDVNVDLAPVNEKQTEQLIEASIAGKKLKGWRNTPPGDVASLKDILMRLGNLAMNHPEVDELEVNPLYVLRDGQGAVAIDIRGALKKTEQLVSE